jgi:hypothetical protein
MSPVSAWLMSVPRWIGLLEGMVVRMNNHLELLDQIWNFYQLELTREQRRSFTARLFGVVEHRLSLKNRDTFSKDEIIEMFQYVVESLKNEKP